MNNNFLLSLFKKKKQIRNIYTLIIIFNIILYILTFISFIEPSYIFISLILIIFDIILLVLLWYFHFRLNKIINEIELYKANLNK